MSQTLTYDTALTLKRGDILFHNILEFGLVEGEKNPATCTVTGKVRKVRGVEEFELPVKRNYGDKAPAVLTRMSRDLWRTTPEKIVPVRIHRARSVPTPALPHEPSTAEDKTPVTRVRRTRTTETGRIVDDNATLLQNAQDQLKSLRVRRSR